MQKKNFENTKCLNWTPESIEEFYNTLYLCDRSVYHRFGGILH